jgi:Flp pilus assembly protein TadD
MILAPGPRLAVAALAVLALTAWVFAPVRDHEFVDYDDPTFVVENPHVAGGLTRENVGWAFAHAYDATGGPLTWLSHLLDVELFGMTPGPHHVVNAMLHAVNAVLLLIVLWRLTHAAAPSAFAAALFAIHPLHVESVAWVSERKDVLSTLFWLLATSAYVTYVRRGGAARYAGVAALFVLALLAKPVVAVAPFTWLLLDVWPLKRLAEPKPGAKRAPGGGWRVLILEKLPFVALGAAAMAWTLAAQRSIGAVTGVGSLDWTHRAANALVSYVTYLWKTIWPADLAVFYPYPAQIPAWTVVLAAAVLLALSAFVSRTARTHPYRAVGWWWYVGTLVPMIGLVQVGSHARADRFTYVPLIGIFIAVAWSLSAFARTGRVRRRVVVAGSVAAIVASAVVARAQVETWRTSETLWRQARAATGANFRAEAGLAEAARRRGDLDAAIAHYQEAVRLAPDAAEFHVNLGLLLVERNRVAEAITAFQRAVDLRPADAESHNNLGAMLARQGRLADAAAHYRRALDISPAYALARRNLGLALAAGGDLAGGIHECLEALKLSPNEAQWHYEVGVMLANAGQTREAVAHLQDAIRIAPQHAGARAALAALGK